LAGFEVTLIGRFWVTAEERFLYDAQTYRPWKYGLLHGLGFGGLFCFALAYIVLAGGVACAVIYRVSFAGHPPAFPFNLQFPQ
jgi:hypothetical protein